jgi:hypothetical protein
MITIGDIIETRMKRTGLTVVAVAGSRLALDSARRTFSLAIDSSLVDGRSGEDCAFCLFAYLSSWRPL